MDRQKTGEFLKHLRKNKGLTQEQFAEHFCVSSRTVSRWETGNNMPDVDMLIEIADFYNVDIREIIDGEKIVDGETDETKDTAKKIAAYAMEKAYGTQTNAVYIMLGVCVSILVCNFLFSDGVPGLLYGIISEQTCSYIRILIHGLSIFLMISYLRAYMWQEKPAKEPQKTIAATVVAKEVKPGTHRSGRSKGGYSYLVKFLTEDGQELELFAYEIEFGGLKEGLTGELTYQGRYFVAFK